MVDYDEKIVVTLAVPQRSGYVYIHIGEATTGWWGDVDERSNVVPLSFTVCASLTFSSPLAYVSSHSMTDKTMTNEFDTGVGARVRPRMVQVEHVEAHVRRNNGAQEVVIRIAQQDDTVISKKYWGYF